MNSILIALLTSFASGQFVSPPYYDGVPQVVPYWLPRTVHPDVVGTFTHPVVDPPRFYTDLFQSQLYQGPVFCGFNFWGIPQYCPGPVVPLPPHFETNFKPATLVPFTSPIIGPIVDPPMSVPAVVTPPVSRNVITRVDVAPATVRLP